MGIFNQVREIVKHIPKGKVTTYGTIANKIGTSDARLVGWAIWGNRDSSIPCHRVVKKDGWLSPKFSLGGAAEQRKRLEEDGLKFSNPQRVDLVKYLWSP